MRTWELAAHPLFRHISIAVYFEIYKQCEPASLADWDCGPYVAELAKMGVTTIVSLSNEAKPDNAFFDTKVQAHGPSLVPSFFPRNSSVERGLQVYISRLKMPAVGSNLYLHLLCLHNSGATPDTVQQLPFAKTFFGTPFDSIHSHLPY